MALQTGLFTLALSALLMAPVAAKAADMHRDGSHGYRSSPSQLTVERTRWTRSEGRSVWAPGYGYHERGWAGPPRMGVPYRHGVERRWAPPGYMYPLRQHAWGPVYPGGYGPY